MNTTETWTPELHTASKFVKPGLMANSVFYGIHYTALVVLSCSILVSLGVLVFLLAWSKKRFYQRPIGERLVVYLAWCDLIFSVSHCMDHGYLVATKQHPPDALCRLFAVMLMTFILAQSIIVTFTAANCFYMVIMEKRFKLGAYDLRLILPAVGVPLVLSIAAAIPGLFGPGPSWCLIDITHKYGDIASSLMAISLLIVMITNMLMYGLVLGKLKKDGDGIVRRGKYDALAKTLTVFVAVYILQYFAAVITNLWSMGRSPPTACVILTVIFTNLGGVFNFVAYTLLGHHRVSPNLQPGAANG